MRAALLLLIALAIFVPFNIVAFRGLTSLHPRRRSWILGALVIGNLMWPFFPLLRQLTPFSRITRAIFGPPWFAWTSFAIVYTTLLVLLALVWLPLRERMPFARFARWPSRIFLALTIIGSVAGFYQALVPLRVERVPIAIDSLPPQLHGTKIALLSDLHVGLFTRSSRLEQIFATTQSLGPDVVLLAGDLIDDDPYFTAKLLAPLHLPDPSLPILAVLGNHEMYGDPRAFLRNVRGSRIRVLVNEGVLAGGVWIAGISDYAATQMGGDASFAPDIEAALSSRPADTFPIVVAHQPKVFGEARERHVPLTLVGHTHGGQLGFRPLGWSLAGVFLPYHMGLYREGTAQLYVNTGTGYWLVPFRLGMTPEITLIELMAR